MLHAIHDFLPRHRAGSEIYAFELCRQLSARHDVAILCADFDASRPHGDVRWRVHDGLTVIEIINNWVCDSFRDTYASPTITNRIEHVLRAFDPDIVHIHNLLNLSFDLPRLARQRGARVVATLHDYTLVCPSGGQRLHQREQHVCYDIEPERCARCFRESPFQAQLSFGVVARRAAAVQPLVTAAAAIARRFPGVATPLSHAAVAVGRMAPTAADVQIRLDRVRDVVDDVELFVSPSRSVADEFIKLGVPPQKLKVEDYGFPELTPRPTRRPTQIVRFGFVGTLAWHKGAHLLLQAVRELPQHRYELHLFGDTTVFPTYVATLRDAAVGLPVTFHGGFSRADVADVFAAFDALVVPSLWLENSPLVIHEAFQAGVPVIGARIGGIVDLVEDERNGLLYDAHSVEALAATLARVTDAPSLLQDLARARPRVKTIEDDAAMWESIYANGIG